MLLALRFRAALGSHIGRCAESRGRRGEAGRGGGDVGRGVSGEAHGVSRHCGLEVPAPGVMDQPPGDASRRGSSACRRNLWSARLISRRPLLWAARRITSGSGSGTGLISVLRLPTHGHVRSFRFFRAFENVVQHCFVDFII